MLLQPPLQDTKFSLDVSGIAGFLGGEESFAAMATVHFMRNRRWIGWYNSPGSYYVARKYGTLAKFHLWSGLFPGPTVEPAAMLELDSKSGPRFMGVLSGTRMAKTSHLSYLLTRHCEKITASGPLTPLNATANKPPFSVTIVELKDFNIKDPKNDPTISEEHFLKFDYWSGVVTLCTIAGAAMSGLWGDWYSFSMILLGGVSNGLSYFVLGSAKLALDCPEPSSHSPRGDGVLIDDRDIIILQGSEHSVSIITRGRYKLVYKSAPEYRDIGMVSALLTAQFLLQLFLVPQGRLAGQIMFLATFVVSWAFNAHIASIDREKPQTDVLRSILQIKDSHIQKFQVDKWATAAAFVTFYLQSKDPATTLNEFLPNSTPAWNLWKKHILDAIEETRPPKEKLEVTIGSPHLEHGEVKLVNEFLDLGHKAYKEAEDLRAAAVERAKNSARKNDEPVGNV